VGEVPAEAGRAPAEPTRSFGAILIVLGAAQLTAAAGFLVFALAGATGAPWLATAGLIMLSSSSWTLSLISTSAIGLPPLLG